MNALSRKFELHQRKFLEDLEFLEQRKQSLVEKIKIAEEELEGFEAGCRLASDDEEAVKQAKLKMFRDNSLLKDQLNKVKTDEKW